MPLPRSRRAAIRRRRVTTAAIAVVLAVAVAVVVTGHHHGSVDKPVTTAKGAPTSTVEPTPTTAPVQHTGPFAVGSTTVALEEPAGAGAPVRSLPTLVLYPSVGAAGGIPLAGADPDRADGPYPLVVFSQGFLQQPQWYDAILDHWAESGYVVAAPTYPDTDPGYGCCESDIVDHPRDLRFVIASMVQASSGTAAPLAGLVDASEVAVAGQSDGADVSLAVASAPGQRDPQVKAAIIMSGQELDSLGTDFYGAGSVPLLVTQGTADVVNFPSCSVELYNAAPPPKYYLSFLGADHLGPYEDAGDDSSTAMPPASAAADQSVLLEVSTDFLDATLKGSASSTAAMLAAGDVLGVTTITDAASLGPPTSPLCQDTPTP